jgi:hypothetical protein
MIGSAGVARPTSSTTTITNQDARAITISLLTINDYDNNTNDFLITIISQLLTQTKKPIWISMHRRPNA